VINSNLGHYFLAFSRYDQFSVENRTLNFTPSIQPQIWKCSLCTASPEICITQRALTQS